MAEEAKAKKIMVAVDESECSHYALEWALRNIRSSFSPSSPLLIFTVQSIVNLAMLAPASHGCAPPELVRSIQEQQKKVSVTVLEQARGLCEKEGVTPKTILEVGDPKAAICEAAEKWNIDLLVMGSHGRGVIGRAFLGSVSNYCVHNATCPVVVVKKKV